MRRLSLAIGTALLIAPLVPAAAVQTSGDDERAVLATVSTLFDAIATRDTALLRAALLPDARVLPVEARGGETEYGWGTAAEFARTLSSPGPALLERMWDAEVRVSGSLATVWTPYDFYVDGTFSHCGIDAFQLVRTKGGWRIATVTYTRVRPRQRCPASPLGDP